MATSINAKTVIELGVNTGESTVALLEAVHQTGGRLYSVDIQLLPDTKKMLESYGLMERWEFTLMDDMEYVKTWPKDRLADLIFIDTSHQAEHTKREVEAYELLLRPGGFMVFHDTVSCYEGVYKPVKKFLKAHKDWKFENKTNCNGLGILQKPV